jgi:uncharacterized membrane protein
MSFQRQRRPGFSGKPQSGSTFERLTTMYNAFKLIHLVAAIIWMGGMTFMLLALRPAALAMLQPQPRAKLMVAVWQRFFLLVVGAIAALLATGSHLYSSAFRAAKAATGTGAVPLGWTLMLGLGLLMMLIFGHVYFAGFRKFKGAVEAAQWPEAARAAGQIHLLMSTNFVLGWLAIAALRLLP